MFYKKTIQVIFYITCMTLSLHAQSYIDQLLHDNKIVELKKMIDSTKAIENETSLPTNPKLHDLIIIENDYGIKSLFEFYDNQWNDKSHPTIAKILKNDRGTTYKNLFNYKVDAKEFNPYESDNFKYQTTAAHKIVVKILNSSNNEEQINQNIALFLNEKSIEMGQIINIQVNDLDKQNCKIIIIYKN